MKYRNVYTVLVWAFIGLICLALYKRTANKRASEEFRERVDQDTTLDNTLCSKTGQPGGQLHEQRGESDLSLQEVRQLYDLQMNQLYYVIGKKWAHLRSQGNLSFEGVTQNTRMKDAVDTHLLSVLQLRRVLAKHAGNRVMRRLTSYVQSIISLNQNPDDCKEAKKLVCRLTPGCGHMCLFNAVIYCLNVALNKRRVLFLHYQDSADGLPPLFRVLSPLSSTCTRSDLNHNSWLVQNQAIWNQKEAKQTPYYHMPINVYRVARRHLMDPTMWWYSQLAHYLLRAGPNSPFVDSPPPSLPYPTVGIHIRRTDKVSTKESKQYDLSEYMFWAEYFFALVRMDHPNTEKNIFVETDDFSVYSQIEQQFSGYKIIKRNSSHYEPRDSEMGAAEILSAMMYLSQVDYLVCTLSSNVCRVAYILLNFKRDAVFNIHSLDHAFYPHHEIKRPYQVSRSHQARSSNEISIEKGQPFLLEHIEDMGYAQVRDPLKGLNGKIPAYKILPAASVNNSQLFDENPFTLD